MTKIEIFDIGHSNDECQNDLYVKTYDVGHQNGHLNVEHQHVMNVKILSLQRLTLKYGTSKWFECQHHLNVEYQNDLRGGPFDTWGGYSFSFVIKLFF